MDIFRVNQTERDANNKKSHRAICTQWLWFKMAGLLNLVFFLGHHCVLER
jgi:hypothetical protein